MKTTTFRALALAAGFAVGGCSESDEPRAPITEPSSEVPPGETEDDDVSGVEPEPAVPPAAEPTGPSAPGSAAEPEVEPADEPTPGPAEPTMEPPSEDAAAPVPEPEPLSSSGGAGGGFTSGGTAAGGFPSGGSPSGGASGTAADGGTEPEPAATGLRWPIDCVPDETCSLGYPDIDGDGVAFDCGPPGYTGHEGTDIAVTWEQMDAGVDVYAAADGEVLLVFDGKYDRCPDETQPDCAEAPALEPDNMDGVQVCTPLGPYCGTGQEGCFLCFWGGNVVVMRHEGLDGVFATRYDHLKRGSILVAPGDVVSVGQKIAEVGSAGNSTGPHLHFEVWTTGFYELGEPWVGECGPNTTASLWESEPPW